MPFNFANSTDIDAADPTASSGSNPLTLQNFLILGLMGGFTTEISVTGIITTLHQHFSQPAGQRRISLVPVVMTVFNFWCIAYMIIFFYAFNLTSYNCVVGELLVNIFSHFFYLSFDFFILYKTYVISRYNTWVFRCICLLFAHRASWSLTDIIKSGGQWDDTANQCNYYQFPLSGIAYNTADLATDLFCSVVSMGFAIKHLKSNMSTIGQVILQDNVVRSIIILSITCYEIYASFMITDPFMIWMSYLIQNYAYTRCLNLEFLWMGARKKKVTAKSVKGSQAASKAGSATTSHA
ncbi:hypothetical protein BDR26DRAFT_860860 [Obelidium mucronatum]|nr:hypothetical protein BDR26DRAFT_860860 [Obelidium mucronatum]